MLAFLQVFLTSIIYLSQGLSKLYQQNYYLDGKRYLLMKNIHGCDLPGLIKASVPKNRPSEHSGTAWQEVCQVVRLGTRCMEGNTH